MALPRFVQSRTNRDGSKSYRFNPAQRLVDEGIVERVELGTDLRTAKAQARDLNKTIDDWREKQAEIIVIHKSSTLELLVQSYYKSNDFNILDEQNQVFMNFVNSNGNSTEQYPLNPNGSVMGITGVANQDGRVSILMPHPERVFRSIQFSWKPSHWKEYSPWMQIFINAKKFC